MEPSQHTGDIHSISSISALLAALTFVLGGAVVLSGRRRPAYLAFIGLCTNLFCWHLLSIFRNSERLSYLGLFVLVFMPISLLMYLRTWLGEIRTPPEDPPSRVPRPLWLLLIVAELAVGYAYTTRGDPTHRWPVRIPGLVKAATLLGLYGALMPIWRAYLRTISRVDKRRLLYLLGVGVLTVTVAAVDYLPSPYGRGGPALGSLLIIVYLYFLQQTLFLDRLLDINELLGKVVVLSAFVLLLSAILTVMTLIGVEQPQVVTLVSFVILLLYEPLRNLLEGLVHRWTTRERYELKPHLTGLRQRLTNIIDLREAVHVLLSVFEETQRMTHASVYLLDQEGSGYELQGHFGPLPAARLDAAARRPLLQRLSTTRQPVTLEQLEWERQRHAAVHSGTSELSILDAIGRTLVELHAGVAIGIFAGNAGGGQQVRRAGELDPEAQAPRDGEEDWVHGELLLGILCVKDERASEAFSLDELDMLSGVAAQLAITVQNSKIYDRMKERDRLAALGEMAAGLAHEIRNPLGAIKGAAELVAPQDGGQLPEDAGEFLRIIVEETRRLNRVVSQFLDYARPYRGDMASLDVNDVVRKTLPLLTSQAESQKTEIVLDLSPDLARARGDSEQLRQVFLNLAQNALQALESGQGEGRLTISTFLRRGRPGTPQHLEVRFQDNGPGMAAATLQNLFIPFYTTKEKGTGLGLPISQRIISNHGGFIDVRSKLGGGATFTVVLPAADAPPMEGRVPVLSGP